MGWFGKGTKEKAAAAAQVKTARDPVCGMEVDVAKAAATSVHQGRTYYFCAPGCKAAFDKDPAKYLAGSQAGHGGGHGCCS